DAPVGALAQAQLLVDGRRQSGRGLVVAARCGGLGLCNAEAALRGERGTRQHRGKQQNTEHKAHGGVSLGGFRSNARLAQRMPASCFIGGKDANSAAQPWRPRRSALAKKDAQPFLVARWICKLAPSAVFSRATGGAT